MRRGIAIVAGLVALCAASSASARPVTVVDRIRADAGETVRVFANDDIRVSGVCVDNGGGDFTANTFVRARRDNLVLDASGTGVDLDFDRADGPVDATGGDATGTAPVFEGAEYYDFWVESRGGVPLNGRLATGVHIRGADCTFAGTFVGSESGGAVTAARRVTASAGEAVKLFANRDFRITGSCVDNGGGDVTANTLLRARRDNRLYYLTEADQFDTNFDRADGPVDFVPSFYDASGTTPEFRARSFNQDLWTEGSRGAPMQGRVGTGVHVKGADCVFSGLFVGPRDSRRIAVVRRIRADSGEGVTLFANRDFRVTGRCEDNGGGDLTANTFLRARRDNLLYYAYDQGQDIDFDRGDGRIDFTSYEGTGTAASYGSEDDYSDFWGEGRGGRALAGRVGTGVHAQGADCIFSGIFSG